MPDTDLSGDAAKLVRYTLLTVEREAERVIERGELLVTDDMDAQGFRAWVIGRHCGYDGGRNRFLRVAFDVLARYEREPLRHRRRQIEVLEEIRDALRAEPPPPVVVAPAPAPEPPPARRRSIPNPPEVAQKSAEPVPKLVEPAPKPAAPAPVRIPPGRPPAAPQKPRRPKGS